mgnify:FL=1
MKCDNCDVEIDDGEAMYCPQCGQALKQKVDEIMETMFCPKCGAEAKSPDARFCTKCGSPYQTGGEIIEQMTTIKVIASKQEFIQMPKLGEGMMGSLFEGKRRYSGDLALTMEGLAFYSKKVESFMIPYGLIADAKVGHKSNILEIYLKDNQQKTFKVHQADVWAGNILNQVRRNPVPFK